MMANQINNSEVKLSVLLTNICVVSDKDDCVINGITSDSRQVNPGDLFIACQGETVHATDYINAAIERGAIAIIWESQSGTHAIPLASRQSSRNVRIPVLAVAELSNKLGLIAHRFFWYLSKTGNINPYHPRCC
jgi:UDP-N-acetylmuramoyl-L-alanyl-D-glutamate--2,6-diaminopimelate ligase